MRQQASPLHSGCQRAEGGGVVLAGVQWCVLFRHAMFLQAGGMGGIRSSHGLGLLEVLAHLGNSRTKGRGVRHHFVSYHFPVHFQLFRGMY